MSRLFGTDGVRGLANGTLTAELALDISVAAARVLGAESRSAGLRPFAVVGRDPRASGDFLEAAVVAGLTSAGVDVRRLGVLPTPAVARLTADTGADFGVMLSASHNPMPDNGIKFFARGGLKLDDSFEDEIEAQVGVDWQRPTAEAVGRVSEVADAVDRYVSDLTCLVGRRLSGLRVVLDCGDGAASRAAPQAFTSLGADVVAIHASPDGLNINRGCGSTHLGPLQAAVVAEAADVGFAFDGDADRCLAVDNLGEVVDGDEIMAILAMAMKAAGTLAHDTVVATTMSNLGLSLALRRAGIELISTNVGDRYVLEAMRTGGYRLGGEQSGHIVHGEHATTGDGLLTALLVAARMAETGEGIRALARVMTRLPQVLVNVPDVDKDAAGAHPSVLAAVADAEAELGSTGRVLLRPSGTEPLVRVMVEAASEEKAMAVAGRLATVVREALTPQRS